MARKSRKPQREVLNTPCEDLFEKSKYSVGLYARISVDNQRKQESDSIGNQICLLQNFVADKQDMELYSLYVDNGETGTNFERPEFQRLMRDIKAGLVNCVIVKDLSRLGRNHIETGSYIENVFPFLGVRFIAINDNYDSSTASGDDIGLFLPLKNIINEVYAKDISTKVTTQLALKQRKGEFLGSFAPYGYIKSQQDRHRLIVDSIAAPVVKQIFDWKLEGQGNAKIAKALNQAKILPPTRHRYEQGILTKECYSKLELWHKSTIDRILNNPVYVGNMVQGKEKNRFFGSKARQTVPEGQWVVVYDTHEKIIDAYVFEKVQLMLKKA